jgi:tetratricopeptide (TPR) repeat protein
MTDTQSDSEKANRPEGQIRRRQCLLFGILYTLVIGIYAWSAAPGFLETVHPSARDAYYNLLVQGFQEGHLSVKREPSPALAQMANPYDPVANRPYVWDSQHLAQDMSYYHGKLYLYFGVTPAITLFWPYLVLTGHYLSHQAATVILFGCGFLLAVALLHALWRRYFPETGVWVMASGIMIMGLTTGVLEQLASCDMYEIARGCGFVFTMLALAGVWGALNEPKRKIIWLLLASLAYGLAVGSRPSLLFGAIILLAPVAQAWFAAGEPRERWRAGLLLLPAVVPITLVGLGLMLYNARRFDNPFEFGWSYQLAGDVNHPTAHQFSLHYLWYNFRFYFLEPMGWTFRFPFLKALALPPEPPGYGGVGLPFSGVLTDYPITWLALAAPLALKGTSVKNFSPLQWFVTAIFLLFAFCAATICSFIMANSRYEFDFLPDLMLLAVMGVFILERSLSGSTAGRRWFARVTWGLLLGYSIVFNALASVEGHALAHFMIGNVYMNQGQPDSAVEHYQKAVALDPGSADYHFSLGNALSRARQIDESVLEYKRALEIKPDYAEANNNLAYTLLQSGQVADAITYFQQAVKIQPTYEAYYNLGYAYRLNGMAKEAMDCYRQALGVQPNFLPAQMSLAWMLATWPEESVRNGSEAVALGEKMNQLANGTDPKILRTLAAAYAEAGRFPEAVTAAKQALALAPAQSRLADELSAEIQLYQNNSPLHTKGN